MWVPSTKIYFSEIQSVIPVIIKNIVRKEIIHSVGFEACTINFGVGPICECCRNAFKRQNQGSSQPFILENAKESHILSYILLLWKVSQSGYAL